MSSHPAVRAATLALCAMGLGLISPAVRADVIELTNGTKLEGMIDGGSNKGPTVKIRTASGSMAMPRTKIKKITEESPAEDHARLGKSLLQAGRYQEAEVEFGAALKADPSLAPAKEGLARAQAGSNKVAAVQQKAASEDVAKALGDAEQLVKEKKFEEAVAIVRSLDMSTHPELMERYNKLLADGSYQWAVYCLDKQNPVQAEKLLQTALRLNPANEDARKRLVAIYETDPGSLDKVVEINKASKDPNELVKVADALYRQKKFEEALGVYKQLAGFPELRTPERMGRVRNALDMVHTDYAYRGDYAKALEVYSNMLRLFPDEDPVMLAQYEVKLKSLEVDASNPAQVAELAQYAEERGFTDEARKGYAKALSMNPAEPTALAGLNRLAQMDLLDVASLYADAQYSLGASLAQKIEREYAALPDIVAKARELQSQGQEQAAKQAADARNQANAYAARGDDYYRQGQSYVAMMSSTEYDSNVRVVSPKQEATKYYRLAIYAWQTALQLDPSLGNPMAADLTRKISDASAVYARLTGGPMALPRRESLVESGSRNR